MKIGIYTNVYRDGDLTVTKKLMAELDKSGIAYFIFGEAATKLGLKDGFNIKEKISVMITLGGDGTILRIASFCAKEDIPILGLNLGTVGFLTELENGEITKLIEIIKKGKFKTEKRTMLHITFGDKTALALNEAVVSRAGCGKMLSLSVLVNGEFVNSYHCDGFIVSSPTGSTAYSLSAGGAIITPSSQVLALTPINPHTLHSKPIVVSNSDVVTIVLKNESIGVIAADGKEFGEIDKNIKIEVKNSKYNASFIRTREKGFFERLLSKLNSWGVTEEKEQC